MGNYTIFLMLENPRRSRQARNFTENDPKILDLKSSSEQIIFRKLSLGAPASWRYNTLQFHRRLHEGQGKMVLKSFIQESPSNNGTTFLKVKRPTFCNTTDFKYAFNDK